ncbi:MAG: PQQ-like beta-propeller repeat protein [Pirellulales bacterium]|nr:PQQ-like beta-propeller repeat protein [Pirellulales bacterium]
MKPTCVLLALASVMFGLPARAADWPQWRGPDRTGVSQETGLLKQWPATGPKLLWQIKDLGDGYSTPAMAGDRLYLIANSGIENEYVRALSAADGSTLWTTTIGKVGANRGPQYPGARSTPTVDGQRLFALGSDGELCGVDVGTGQLIWKKSLRSDFGGVPGAWAYSESPLVDGDTVVASPGGAAATVVALNKATGDVIWKAALPEADEAAYASAIVANFGGAKQYVQFLQKGLVGLDAATGKQLWRYTKTAEGSPANIPTPIATADSVYSGASRSGGGLVRLVANGSALEAQQVYFAKTLPTSIGGAVKVGDYLYGTNTQGLLCVEFATGEVKWQERSIAPGAVCYADGRIYLHGENGDVALIEATPEAYREQGRFTPPEVPDHGRGKAWTYPVVADGKLYIRDLGTLWCFDVRAN